MPQGEDSMDIVAAEKELRSSTSFDDIHLLWDELFGVTGYNFALFSQGAEFADRVMSETDKNVVSLFQLKSFYFSLPIFLKCFRISAS